MNAEQDVIEGQTPAQAESVHKFDWKAYLLSRRRAIKLELQEIEKLLDMKPKQT